MLRIAIQAQALGSLLWRFRRRRSHLAMVLKTSPAAAKGAVVPNAPKNDSVAMKKGKQFLEIINAYAEGDKAWHC